MGSTSDKGRANIALTKFLASTLNIPTKAITIKSGTASRNKTLEIALPPAKLLDQLPPRT